MQQLYSVLFIILSCHFWTIDFTNYKNRLSVYTAGNNLKKNTKKFQVSSLPVSTLHPQFLMDCAITDLLSLCHTPCYKS